MTDKIRKPISDSIRKLFNPDVETVWIECSNCHCEYEITKSRNELNNTFEVCARPKLCYDCLNKAT